MAFLIAFACSVASVQSPAEFRCADNTEVRLASAYTTGPLDKAAMTDAIVGLKLRCQGFASDGPGQLTATCRLPSGEDVARNIMRRTPGRTAERDAG